MFHCIKINVYCLLSISVCTRVGMYLNFKCNNACTTLKLSGDTIKYSFYKVFSKGFVWYLISFKPSVYLIYIYIIHFEMQISLEKSHA